MTRKSQTEALPLLETIEAQNGRSRYVESEYILLQELLQQLPPNKKWTQEKRNRWLQAFTASVDLLIDIEAEGREDTEKSE